MNLVGNTETRGWKGWEEGGGKGGKGGGGGEEEEEEEEEDHTLYYNTVLQYTALHRTSIVRKLT